MSGNRSYKHNWLALKQEYLLSDNPSFKVFAKYKGISYNTFSKYAKGWRQEYEINKEKENEDALRLMRLKNSKAVVGVIEKHVGIARMLQEFGMKGLIDEDKAGKKTVKTPDNKDQAMKALMEGANLESKIYELDKEKPPIIQNNTLIMTETEKVDLEKDVLELMDYYKQKEKLKEALKIRRIKRVN